MKKDSITSYSTDSVFPLVLKLSFPTMLAQLVNVLYSVVDRIFIGNIDSVGSLALAGVGVASPIVTLISSFASLIGLGGAPLMAINIGKENYHKAQKILNNAFLSLLILSVFLMLLFLSFSSSLVLTFGATDLTFAFAKEYLVYYLLGTPFALIATGMNSYLICQGRNKSAMTSVLLGAFFNIALDPLFIFAFGMGVKGAAVATVISQAFSASYTFFCLFSKKLKIRLSFSLYSLRAFLEICKFGLSPFLIIATDSILILLLNFMLKLRGGSDADFLITCATIVQSYMLLIFQPLGGITAGSQGLISFNYGSSDSQRVRKAIYATLLYAVLFTLLMTVFTFTRSEIFASLFTQDEEILSKSISYMRIYTSCVILLAFQYTFVDSFTALAQIRFALPLSLFRKLIYAVSLVIFPLAFSAEAIFYAEPVCDVVASIASTSMMILMLGRILKKDPA